MVRTLAVSLAAQGPARQRSPWVVILPAVTALLLALGLWLEPDLNQAGFAALNALARGPAGAFWLFATLAGDTAVVLALLSALHWRRPLAIRAVPATLLIVTLLTHIPKPLVAAPRPVAVLGLDLVTVLGPVLTSQSFPSGHAAAAFAGAALVCLAGASVLSSTLALIAACLIALSRCVVGAHWPLDIAMGAALGWLGAWLGVVATERLGPRAAPWLHGLGLVIVALGWLGVVTQRIVLLR
jgi:membrane-associated phospholipid phosphatase